MLVFKCLILLMSLVAAQQEIVDMRLEEEIETTQYKEAKSAYPEPKGKYAPLKCPTDQGGYCYEPESPLEPWKRRPVPCKLVKAKASARSGDKTGQSALAIDLSCKVKENCDLIKKTMEEAGMILGNVLMLDEPLRLNATFLNFCTEMNKCATPQYTMLGGAAPARTFLLTDVDGMPRAFPQALVKQLNSNEHPAYAPYDITAQFNSEASWWFKENGPIKADQHDFLFVVLHELIHGLGFTSAWNDYINDKPLALTPNPMAPGQNDIREFNFTGFYENAFDRFLIEMPSMRRLTEITRKLNSFENDSASKNISTREAPGLREIIKKQANATASILKTYQSQDDFIQRFTASQGYQGYAIGMLEIATQPNRIAFWPDGAKNVLEAIPLETSLKEFTVGSSIIHVDYKRFSNTSDFLMRFLQEPGETVEKYVEENGNSPGGPLGPSLIRILSTMGYPVNKQPQAMASRLSGASKSHLSSVYLLAAVIIALLV